MKNTKETVGQRIARLRKAAGYSQESFGVYAKIKRRTLQNIEYDKGSTSAENIQAIAKALGVSESMLMGTEFPKESVAHGGIKSDLILKIQARLIALDEKQLRLLDSVIDDLPASASKALDDSSTG